MSNSPLNRFLLLAFCYALFAIASAASEGGTVPAFDITAVTVASEPDGSYRITARGHMRTGGHVNPRLRKTGTRKDGELVLELVADAPPQGAMVAMVLQPVSAEYRIPGAGYRSVRVVGETNGMQRRLPRR